MSGDSAPPDGGAGSVSTPAVARARMPFHVMTKPIGPICNLACKYCFYLEKEVLFQGNTSFRMKPEVLERYIREYIQAQPSAEVTFAWQGGEPTLMGLPFFERVVELQQRYAEGRTIHNSFQTNGTLLDEAWGRFLHQHQFLVGLSIDGPRELHDTWRVDRRQGPTFDSVMRGLEVLKRCHVEFNTLTCVNRRNAVRPLEVYRFLRGIGSKFLQFIPIVERLPNQAAQRLGLSLAAPASTSGTPDPARLTPWSVLPLDYGEFLCQIFDRWVRHDVGRVYVQDFDGALAAWLGAPPAVCVHAEVCGRAFALEHDGGVYACDHFVYPDYFLGNLMDQSLAEIADSAKADAFGQAKRDTLPTDCLQCPVRFACQGGCPKHRFSPDKDGGTQLNHLCAGYKRFFLHVAPAMQAMATLVRQGQPASRIMDSPEAHRPASKRP